MDSKGSKILFKILIYACFKIFYFAKLNCQGDSYEIALLNCPDFGVQKASSGGNIIVDLIKAINLPNYDYFGHASGMTDSYIKVIYGNNNVVKSKIERNNLNPTWNERLTLGYMRSGELISFELWDYDIGLEFADDLVAKKTFRVPYCSFFTANITDIKCDNPYGCEFHDSLWAFPNNKRCTETIWINLNPSKDLFDEKDCIANTEACLLLNLIIIPFSVKLDQIVSGGSENIQLSIFNNPINLNLNQKLLDTMIGFPFISDLSTKYNVSQSNALLGAVSLRFPSSDKTLGPSELVSFYMSVNMPSTIYICRDKLDNLKGIPKWLQKWDKSSESIHVEPGNIKFECFYINTTGTVINKYGGIVSGVIPIRFNSIVGFDTNSSTNFYQNMYIVLAVPTQENLYESSNIISYDRFGLILTILEYGIIWFWFVFLVTNFLIRINFRMDRIYSYVVNKSFTGESKNILAILFIEYHNTPSNISYRSHLYHSRSIIYFLLCIPFLLLFSWGYCFAAKYSPVLLGMVIAWVGNALLFLLLGYKLWSNHKWHLTIYSIVSFAISLIFIFVYLFHVIFYGESNKSILRPFWFVSNVNFGALSIVFGTLNLIPLIYLTVLKNYPLNSRTNQINNKLYLGIIDTFKGPKPNDNLVNLSFAKSLHILLGNAFTINPYVPQYQYVSVFHEIISDRSQSNLASLFYYLSLGFLFIYLIISLNLCPSPSLSILNVLTLTMLDFVQFNFSKFDMQSIPFLSLSLLIIGRLLIMSSQISTWLINYSFTYLVFGAILIMNIINRYLPILSTFQAGEIAFLGKISEDVSSDSNYANSPLFSFFLLTFAFVCILLIAVLDEKQFLPIDDVKVAGVYWKTSMIALMCIFLLFTYSLVYATIRAFYLKSKGYLRQNVKSLYLYYASFDLPFILLCCTEFCILAFGILLTTLTKCNIFVILSVFIPVIALCFCYSCVIWVTNDFELVVWPPKADDDKQIGDTPSDLENALNLIEGLFESPGPETDEEGLVSGLQSMIDKSDANPSSSFSALGDVSSAALGSHTTRSKSLKSVSTPVKLPPLPLKRILRKRNIPIKSSIETKKSLFKNDPEVVNFLAADDPWQLFEPTLENIKHQKNDNLEPVSNNNISRRGFLQHPFYLRIKQIISHHPLGKFFVGTYNKMNKSITDRRRAYQRIDPEDQTISSLDDKVNATEELSSDSFKNLQAEIAKMSFINAVRLGHLTNQEYLALIGWFGGMALILIMGVIISLYVQPMWLGHVIWASSYIFICTAIPIIKYFNTYMIDKTILSFVWFVLIFHFSFCLLFFLIPINYDLGNPASLWILDFFVYYPMLIYVFLDLSIYYECDFSAKKKTELLSNFPELNSLFNTVNIYPLIFVFIIVLNWQFFIWIGELVGIISVLCTLVIMASVYILNRWINNDIYFNPSIQHVNRRHNGQSTENTNDANKFPNSNEKLPIQNNNFNSVGTYFKAIHFCLMPLALISTFFASLFSDGNPILPISIFFVILILHYLSKIFSRLISIEKDIVFYLSPYLLPAYSFDSINNDLKDESELILNVLSFVLLSLIWGVFISVFHSFKYIGLTFVCFFIMLFLIILGTSISFVPYNLGNVSSFITVEGIEESLKSAVDNFNKEKAAIDLVVKDWIGETDKVEYTDYPTYYQSLQTKNGLDISIESIKLLRSLSYSESPKVQNSDDALQQNSEAVVPNVKFKLSIYISKIIQFFSEYFDEIPLSFLNGWSNHKESLFTLMDALTEPIVTGKGPLGFIGLEGSLFEFILKAITNPRYKFLKQPWLEAYDETGNRKDFTPLPEKCDSSLILSKLLDCDKAITDFYSKEFKCAAFFLTLIKSAATSFLERKTILFQKFLRENRFRLASNGIPPPTEIFSTSSYSSIDIQLVTVWLYSLTPEELERFNMLMNSFTDDQNKKDNEIVIEDKSTLNSSFEILKESKIKHLDFSAKHKRNFELLRLRKVQEFESILTKDESVFFNSIKDAWLSNADIYVSSDNHDLYEKFLNFILHGDDAVLEYARQVISEIEGGQLCKAGQDGREFQFIDPDFFPGEKTLGDTSHSNFIQEWKSANSISIALTLFDEHVNPDNLVCGIFKDNWLLSAITMLAAHDSLTNSEFIKNIFIKHISSEGDLHSQTNVGVYCIRFYQDGLWYPIFVDDFIPILEASYANVSNKGIAATFSKQGNCIWATTIEKAFAKYYGGYSNIEKGFVHHALEQLTGCETECISIHQNAKGSGKPTLWKQLLSYKDKGFILGAGTGKSKFVDKEILEMGIVFESAYCIYDVRYIYGQKLLKLRNPPGDHEEWKGDWSDKSALWTKRLKHKLDWKDVDDNTFWMSFDDFCNVFRYIFVCKSYGKQWKHYSLSGIWKKSNELENDMKNEIKKIIADSNTSENNDNIDYLKNPSKLRIDTSGGLPTKHNPACILENNPHYVLSINRPVDFNLRVSQTDSRGLESQGELIPFAIYILKNEHPKTPMRVKYLSSKNVKHYSGAPKNLRVQHITGSLDPGLYIILVAPYVSGMEGNFTVELHSNYDVGLTNLWPPAWMMTNKNIPEYLS